MASTQNTIQQTNLPSFPWSDGDKLYAVPVNNQFIALQNQIDSMSKQIAGLQAQSAGGNQPVSITTNWGGSTGVTEGIYTLTGSAPYQFYITEVDVNVGDAGGSFNVTVLNDFVVAGNLQNLVVDTFTNKQYIASGSNLTVNRGGTLQIQVTNMQGNPLDAFVTIIGATVLQPQPQIGVSSGTVRIRSMAVARGAPIGLDQAVGDAKGVAKVQATGLGASSGVGLAQGAAIVVGPGVQVSLGNTTGQATGTSTANATGATSTAEQSFIMDDPVYGILDTNPLL